MPVTGRVASLADFGVRSASSPEKPAKTGDITETVNRPTLVDPQPPTQPKEDAPSSEDIVVYWERLRRGRPMPPLNDIDRGIVAKWPDSLLVLFDCESPAMPRVSRLGAADGAIEYTPMVTDWILSRARHAQVSARQQVEVQSFPRTGRYRLFALPLAANGGSSGVLCHLCRAS